MGRVDGAASLENLLHQRAAFRDSSPAPAASPEDTGGNESLTPRRIIDAYSHPPPARQKSQKATERTKPAFPRPASGGQHMSQGLQTLSPRLRITLPVLFTQSVHACGQHALYTSYPPVTSLDQSLGF